jgi:hypothetical protein
LFSKLKKAAADSGFNRAERLSQSRGNLVMREMPEKRKVDRLSLLLGQVV